MALILNLENDLMDRRASVKIFSLLSMIQMAMLFVFVHLIPMIKLLLAMAKDSTVHPSA
jgi:hypothetical protein